MAIAGLAYPTMVEHNGILYLTGYREGAVVFRRSVDRGVSWSDEVQIGPGDEARAGLVKMESGGRRLMAAISRDEAIDIYVSADDGETWLAEGEV